MYCTSTTCVCVFLGSPGGLLLDDGQGRSEVLIAVLWYN